VNAHAIQSPPAELDEVTFSRAKRGDERAFRELVVRYQRPVYQVLWRMVEGTELRHRVEDLTQETFVRVFQALDRFSYKGSARPSTWILTIATRLALNELRRTRRTVPIDQVADHLTSADRADSAAHRRRLGQHIARAIAELPPKFRAALVLREYHHLEYEDIASALEIDLGTVKSRLSRARAQLRDALEEVHND
jgi:RNA polymerase sigma-70 factor (ECF subfamily)